MRFLFLIILILFVQAYPMLAQTIWGGPKITFTKNDGTDWTLEANQDRITDSVWITRANRESIFNIALESSCDDNQSPIGTLWAEGTTSEIGNLTFDTLYNSIGRIRHLLDKNLVLYLIKEDVYIDIKFTSWSRGKDGGNGGFSYERSTLGSTSTTNTISNDLAIYPNPASSYIIFNNVYDINTLELIDLNGSTVKIFSLNKGENNLDLKELSAGTYLLISENLGSVKVIKR